MNEDLRRILDLLDEDLLQGLEGLLVKEEGLKQKDWPGYPDVLMKKELKGYLSEYEERWHSTQTMAQLSPDDSNLAERANDYRKGVATGHAFAGWVACEGGHYSEALALLAREGELRGSLYSMGALYRAAAHAGMGDVELAKQCLIDFEGQETKDGQALRFLKQRREFDVLRSDKEYLAITRAWS